MQATAYPHKKSPRTGRLLKYLETFFEHAMLSHLFRLTGPRLLLSEAVPGMVITITILSASKRLAALWWSSA